MVGERIKAYLDMRLRVVKENISDSLDVWTGTGPVTEVLAVLPKTELRQRQSDRRAKARRELLK